MVACFTFFLDNSATISDALHAYRVCAMGAAIEGSIGLYPVPNDFTAAVLAGRGKSSNRAFKAVEHMRPTGQIHLKGLIVLVPADFTLCHAHDLLSLIRLACPFTFTPSITIEAHEKFPYICKPPEKICSIFSSVFQPSCQKRRSKGTACGSATSGSAISGCHCFSHSRER